MFDCVGVCLWVCWIVCNEIVVCIFCWYVCGCVECGVGYWFVVVMVVFVLRMFELVGSVVYDVLVVSFVVCVLFCSFCRICVGVRLLFIDSISVVIFVICGVVRLVLFVRL